MNWLRENLWKGFSVHSEFPIPVDRTEKSGFNVLIFFGRVEDSVMNACITYLKISAYSYPALAIYNSGAAVYRSLGKTNVTMYVSVFSTIAGRLFLSYLLGIAFHMGAVGIAVAMVCDWVIRAVIFVWRQKSGKWKVFQVI